MTIAERFPLEILIVIDTNPILSTITIQYSRWSMADCSISYYKVGPVLFFLVLFNWIRKFNVRLCKEFVCLNVYLVFVTCKSMNVSKVDYMSAKRNNLKPFFAAQWNFHFAWQPCQTNVQVNVYEIYVRIDSCSRYRTKKPESIKKIPAWQRHKSQRFTLDEVRN